MIADWNIGHAFTHPWFWSSFLGWTIAQCIKMTTNAVKNKTLDMEYLVSTGGMPSAHSAMATGLAASIGLTEGFGTPLAMLAMAGRQSRFSMLRRCAAPPANRRRS